MRSEDTLHGGRLSRIAKRGARAVGVDVVDGVGVEPGVSQGHGHRSRCPQPFLVRLRDVPRVAAGPVALEFAIDAGPTPSGMLQFLEHDHPGTFCEHETVAIDIEGPARLLRGVAAKREGTHVLEARQPHRGQRGLAAACQHHVGIAVLDGSQGAADRVGGAGAGGRCGDVHPLGSEQCRDMPAGGVQQKFRDEEGGDLVDALGVKSLVLGLKLVEPADPGADRHAAAVRILL